MSRQPLIRLEIEEAEGLARHHLEWMQRFEVLNMEREWRKSLSAYHHYMSRRRFFLRDLLKVQLKEFNYE